MQVSSPQLISRRNKTRIAQLYKQKWNVKVNNIDVFTPERLEEVLSKKASLKQQTKAVIKIQTMVRGRRYYS